MTSQPKQSDLDWDRPELSSSVEDENSTLTEENLSQEKTESLEKQNIRIEIPEPDADNITVLTDKLPNKPILPWNHYDSPWEGSETESDENGASSPDSEPSTDEIIDRES